VPEQEKVPERPWRPAVLLAVVHRYVPISSA
jgi:hypothetical protein